MTPEDTNDDQPPFSTDGSGSESPGTGDSQQPEAVPEVEGYILVCPLSGKGGQGTVWRAMQLSTNRQVALKFLNADAIRSQLGQTRFEREVALAARLEHPNIARIYDSGLHRGDYYYAMELINGVHLDDFARAKQLSLRQILKLMRLVCRTVDYAHQRGIIHRDLKPSNIMVTPDGQPHVLDFGLAKTITAAGSTDLSLSVDGELAGTPAYMSPEQAMAKMTLVDTRSDVYSLGVVLYRLLTGEFPHDLSGPRYEVLHRISTEGIRSPRQFNTEIDRPLEALLLKALDRERDRRYANAGQLAYAIEKYLRGELVAEPDMPAASKGAKPKAKAKPAGFARSRKPRRWVHSLLVFAGATAAAALAVYVALWIAGRRPPELQENECIDNGWSLYDKGDVTGALPWHVKALELSNTTNKTDPTNNRIRVGNLLRQIAIPRVLIKEKGIIGAWLSADGNLVAAAFSDQTVQLYETQSGVTQGGRLKHEGALSFVAIGPGGRKVVIASNEQASLWNTQAGTKIQSLSRPGKTVMAAFSFDGTRIVTAGDDACIWSEKGGEMIANAPLPHNGPVDHAEFSRDGKLVLTAGESNGAGLVCIRNVETGKPVSEFRPAKPVNQASFNNDGTGIITLSTDNAVEFWWLRTGNASTFAFRPILKPEKKVLQAALCPSAAGDPCLAMAVCDDNTVQFGAFWDAAGASPASDTPGMLPLHQMRAASLAAAVFTPEGRNIISVSRHEAGLWIANTPFTPLLPPVAKAGAANPRKKAAGAQNATQVLDGTTDPLVKEIQKDHLAAIKYAARSGDLVVTASDDHTARVWDAKTGKPITLPHHGAVMHAALSSDLLRVATTSVDGSARVWDANTGKAITAPLWHMHQPVFGVDFAPDQNHLTTSCGFTPVDPWDVSPDIRTVQQLTDLAQFLAGRKLNDEKLEDVPSNKIMDLWDKRAWENAEQ